MEEWREHKKKDKLVGKVVTEKVELDLQTLEDEYERHKGNAERIQQRLDKLDLVNEGFEDQSLPSEADRTELEMDLASGRSVFKWSANKDVKRTVWVYLWKSTIFKWDKWSHFVEKLSGVQLTLLDPSKVNTNAFTVSNDCFGLIVKF